tara:strand:+ start:145 stop:702 length:558 start_codon:yes stop_codon:yes gene_type:complete
MYFADNKIRRSTPVLPSIINKLNKDLEKYDNKKGVKEYRENLKVWLEDWVKASSNNKNYINKNAMNKYETIQNKRKQILKNFYSIKPRTEEQRLENQKAVRKLAERIFIRNLTTIRNTNNPNAFANALKRVMQSDFGSNKVMGVSSLKLARNATNPNNKSRWAKKGAIMFLQTNIAKQIIKNNSR